MANRSKYKALCAHHRHFERSFRQRVDRGDTDQDLAFWIRVRYDVRVSHEAIRQWRIKYQSELAA